MTLLLMKSADDLPCEYRVSWRQGTAVHWLTLKGTRKMVERDAQRIARWNGGELARLERPAQQIHLENNVIDLERRVLLGPDADPEIPKAPSGKTPAQWREMSDDESRMAKQLAQCRFVPGSSEKRFAAQLGAQALRVPQKITERQAQNLRRLVHRFRRQIPPAVVALAQVGAP